MIFKESFKGVRADFRGGPEGGGGKGPMGGISVLFATKSIEHQYKGTNL